MSTLSDSSISPGINLFHGPQQGFWVAVCFISYLQIWWRSSSKVCLASPLSGTGPKGAQGGETHPVLGHFDQSVPPGAPLSAPSSQEGLPVEWKAYT